MISADTTSHQHKPRRFYAFFPLLFLLLISFLYCFPLLKDLSSSCRGDWDYCFHLYEVASISLYEYGQLPLWNPYSGGGMPGIASPHSGFPSLTFLAATLFGVVAGLKISVWLHTFLGLWGMWVLGGYLGIAGAARFASPIIFMFTSSWAMRLTEGHITWLPVSLLPFLFFFYLKSFGNFRWLLASAAIESLIFYGGGVYVFAYSLLFMGIYAVSLSVEKRAWRPVLTFCMVNLTVVGLTAPKLFPMLELLVNHPRVKDVGYSVTWDQFLANFIERNSSLGMLERNSYVGIIVVVLYLCSLVMVRNHAALKATSLGMLSISLGNFAVYSPWALLHGLPLFRNFQVPERSLIVFVFSSALLVGLYLGNWVDSKSKVMAYIVGGIVLLIGVDLFSLGYEIFGEVYKPINVSVFRFNGPMTLGRPAELYRVSPDQGARLWRSDLSLHRPFRQISVPDLERFAHGGWSDQYLPLLRNEGVVDAYEPIPFDCHASAYNDPAYRGEYFLTGQGTAVLREWSPNKMVYQVELPSETRLVINQNFWPGWRSSSGAVVNHKGLLAVDLHPGTYDITASYLPRSFLIGVGVMGITLTGILFLVLKGNRKIILFNDR